MRAMWNDAKDLLFISQRTPQGCLTFASPSVASLLGDDLAHEWGVVVEHQHAGDPALGGSGGGGGGGGRGGNGARRARRARRFAPSEHGCGSWYQLRGSRGASSALSRRARRTRRPAVATARKRAARVSRRRRGSSR